LPNESNAKRVTEIAYTLSKGGISHNYDARDLEILGLQINSGDAAAIQLTFRLLNKSDGGLLEDLVAMLGHVIRAHPKLFLEQLALAQAHINTIESILLHAGLEYVDRPTANRYELEMRYKSILAVHSEDVKVRQLQNECLKILKQQLERASMRE
jgi:hypothetical protein